jgi:integrase
MLKVSEPSRGNRWKIRVRDMDTGKTVVYVSGRVVGDTTKPDSLSQIEKEKYFYWLKRALEEKIAGGWVPKQFAGKPKKAAQRTAWELAVDQTLKTLKGLDAWYVKQIHRHVGVMMSEFETFPTQDEFTRFIKKRFNTGRTTMHMAKRRFSAFFSHMVDLELLDYNPAEKIKVRTPQPTRNHVYTKQQLRDLFGFLKEHRPALYLCCYLTYKLFLRPHTEVRQLRWEYFDWDNNTVNIPPRYTKNRKARTLPLDGETLRELRWWGIDHEGWVMGREYNKDYFKTQWGRLRKEYKLEPYQTLYSVRHTAACLFYNEHKDIHKLMLVMGHASTASTLNYLKNAPVQQAGVDELKVLSLDE